MTILFCGRAWRLQSTDSERVADMGKSPGNKPKDPIPFVAEKTGPLT